jgi:histidine triad (HIT) family protein
MSSIFTKIVNGEIPCYKIAETEDYLAFLDVRPQVKGHTLVIPKIEIDYIFDIDDELLSGMLPFAKRIAHAIKEVVPCKRIGVAVLGIEVPHAHIHLIPVNQVSDLRFDNVSPDLSPEEMESLAAEIKSRVSLV